MRHGESEWNKDNRFCGWVDVPLSNRGVEEGITASKLLKAAGYSTFNVVHTSLLKRSIETANIIIEQLNEGTEHISNKTSLTCLKHWRLNERHYGALTGLNKIEMVKLHGMDKVMEWRRSYDSPPPPMTKDHPYYGEIGRYLMLIRFRWVDVISI